MSMATSWGLRITGESGSIAIRIRRAKSPALVSPCPTCHCRIFSRPQEEGIYEGAGSDGTYRFYAYKKLRLAVASPPYGYVFVGADKDAVLADANRELNRNLILLGLAMLLAFAAAWVLGNISFVTRLRKLTDASRRLAEGDLQSRTGLPSGTDEISRTGPIRSTTCRMPLKERTANASMPRRRSRISTAAVRNHRISCPMRPWLSIRKAG